ncbi:hypothetical protein C2E23DRAFT_473015 [Lenzites betulinus]|nr:hypothetical protein C2E23DRAFT_473015 [Lenzites betulinus]
MLSAMSAQLYTMTKQVQDRSRRSWYRLLFYDHPGYICAGHGDWHNIIYSANTMILSCCYVVDADGAMSPGPSKFPHAPEGTDAGNASRRAMGFDAIIFSDMERVDEDLPGADIAFPSVHHITLDTLFDFQTDYWGHNRRRRACQLWTMNLLYGRFSTWMPMGRKCRGAVMSRDSILIPWLTVFSVAASPIERVCTEYGRVDEHLTEIHNGAW